MLKGCRGPSLTLTALTFPLVLRCTFLPPNSAIRGPVTPVPVALTSNKLAQTSTKLATRNGTGRRFTRAVNCCRKIQGVAPTAGGSWNELDRGRVEGGPGEPELVDPCRVARGGDPGSCGEVDGEEVVVGSSGALAELEEEWAGGYELAEMVGASSGRKGGRGGDCTRVASACRRVVQSLINCPGESCSVRAR